MDWLVDGALSWEKILAFIVTLFGAIGAVVSWFWRKVSSRVSAGVTGVEKGQAAIMARLKEVEKDVEAVQSDVGGLQTRMSDVEKSLSNLATSREVAAVDRQIAGLTAQVNAQSTTMRMLYEAAMRADSSGGKK